MSAFVDRTGQRYGSLVVERFAGISAHRARWFLRCDCGGTKEVLAQNLTSGQSTHCNAPHHRRAALLGKNATHGMSGSSAHQSWTEMRRRCMDPRREAYQNYGARGITVCEAWQSFETFFADMGAPPPGAELERIDVNGNYEPSNCRWATLQEQANNKRNNRMVWHEGRLLTIAEYARATGIAYSTAYAREVIRRRAPTRADLAAIERPDQLNWE